MKIFLLCFIILLNIIITHAQTGISVAGFSQSDNLVSNFLNTWNIPGATMALSKNGKLIYLRAFGYSDVNKTVPTQPNNLFRIASLSKQITSVAIMKLLEEGKLSLTSKVFDPVSGILRNHPVFSHANITDTRIYDITIQNLLEHEGGWNRDYNCNPDPTTPYPYFLSGCDPISYPLRVTLLTGTSNPVSKEALITYELERGLDFAPGTGYNYSNIGFLMLGEVIETLTGKNYEDYVKDSILSPLGIYDMHIAKNLKSDKQEREGEYVGNGYTSLSIYGDNTYVPWEYGGFNVTAMDSHGGWITTAKDLLKLQVAVDGFSTKPDILQPATIAIMTTPSANNSNYAKGWMVNQYNNWWHTGSLDGTASEQVRAANGYSWVIILNKRDISDNQNQFWTDLDNLGWNCIDAATSFPDFDLMADPTKNASNITFTNVSSNALTINWEKGNGDKRLVVVGEDSALTEFPLDGNDYNADSVWGNGSAFGNNFVVYNDTGNSVTVTGLSTSKKYYARIIEYNKNMVTGNYALYLLGNNPQASRTMLSTVPIALVSFTASVSNNAVSLKWLTAEESNTDYFTIEKSTGGMHFSAIATLSAKGNSATQTNYFYNDAKPAKGKNYYRLRITDKDATSTYSDTRIVEISPSIVISPNPAKGTVNVYGASDKQQLQMFNTSGEAALSADLKAGVNSIDVSNLSPGLYILKLSGTKNSVETYKLIIKK